MTGIFSFFILFALKHDQKLGRKCYRLSFPSWVRRGPATQEPGGGLLL